MERRPSISKQPTGSTVGPKLGDLSKEIKIITATDTGSHIPHAGSTLKVPHLQSDVEATADAPSPSEGDGMVKGMVKTIEEAVKGKQPLKETSPVKGTDRKSSTSTSVIEGGDMNKASTSGNFSTSLSW